MYYRGIGEALFAICVKAVGGETVLILDLPQ